MPPSFNAAWKNGIGTSYASFRKHMSANAIELNKHPNVQACPDERVSVISPSWYKGSDPLQPALSYRVKITPGYRNAVVRSMLSSKVLPIWKFGVSTTAFFSFYWPLIPKQNKYWQVVSSSHCKPLGVEAQNIISSAKASVLTVDAPIPKPTLRSLSIQDSINYEIEQNTRQRVALLYTSWGVASL